MGAIASQITSLTIVYPTVYSDAEPVTRKMFPFDDVIMKMGDEISRDITVRGRMMVDIWTYVHGRFSFGNVPDIVFELVSVCDVRTVGMIENFISIGICKISWLRQGRNKMH